MIKQEFLDKIKSHEILSQDQNDIIKALNFGEKKHSNQKRKYNEDPYFIHPIRVAKNMITETDTNRDLIIGALLHDTVEDTNTEFEEIEKDFGSGVKILVWGMTKVNSSYKKKWGRERYYNEGFFGPLKKTAETDPRIWKIKLSDRSDNMMDYHKFQPKEKIKEYAWETEQLLNFAHEYKISSPLVNRLKGQLKEYLDLLE